MTLRDRWEEHAGEWIRWARAPGHDSYWQFHRDQFLDLLPPPGIRTVDVGCGEGRLSRDLRDLGHRVIAIDASATMVTAAREADPTMDVRFADAAALPLEDACTDLVIAFMSLQDVGDMPAAIREAARVLEPGGRLCLAIVHPVNSAGRFADRTAEAPFVITSGYLQPFDDVLAVERDGLTMTFHSRHRPLQDYFAALEAAGLVVETLREPSRPEDAVAAESDRRWQRVPLFLHLRARRQ